MTFAAFRFAEVQRGLAQLASAERLTLIVGAGVSLESSLPSWPELVRRVAERVALREFGPDELDDGKSWVEATIEQDQLLGTAAVASSLSSEAQLQRWIVNVLYSSDGPEAYSPGPTARELARLFRIEGIAAELVTLNYDDLLEEALRAEFPDTPVAVLAAEGDAAAEGELLVTHLHGYAGRDATRGPLVLAEEQYQAMLGRETWQERLMLERLNDTTCLFLGTSLTDANLLRYLYRYESGDEPRHVAVFVRQGTTDHLPGKVASVREKAVRERWRQRGVRAVFLDHFGDVSQFIHELGRSRLTGEAYRSVETRASQWLGQVERELLGTGGDDAFRQSQIDLSAHFRVALAAAIEAATDAGADFSSEATAVGLWLADGKGNAITNWVTSDRAYQQRATITPVSVEPDSNWVSVDAFRRCVRVQEGREIYASRWRYVRGLPIVVDHAEHGRLPVGCLTITSTAKAGESALDGMSDTVEARFHQTLLDAVRGLWE